MRGRRRWFVVYGRTEQHGTDRNDDPRPGWIDRTDGANARHDHDSGTDDVIDVA
jgi:hypothetical protein